MRQDVNGLIVEVEEATQALADGHERPVTGVDVRIELEMTRHVAPSSQQQDLGRRFLLMMHDGLGAAVHARPVVVLLALRLVRVSGVLVRRSRHRMARSLVGPKRRRANAPRIRGTSLSRGEEQIIRPATTTASERRDRIRDEVRGRLRARRALNGGDVVTASRRRCCPPLARLAGWQQPSSARDSASLTVPSSRQPSSIPSLRPKLEGKSLSLSRDLAADACDTLSLSLGFLVNY